MCGKEAGISNSGGSSLPICIQIVPAASVGRGANTRKPRREWSKVSNVDVDTTHFMAAGEGDSNGSQIQIVLPSCKASNKIADGCGRRWCYIYSAGHIGRKCRRNGKKKIGWGEDSSLTKAWKEFLLEEDETIVKKLVVKIS